MPVGRPCSNGRSSPRRTAASAALASLRARSTHIAVTALTAGFTSSMRSRQASSSSTGEISLVPMRRRISTDDSETSSFLDIISPFQKRFRITG